MPELERDGGWTSCGGGSRRGLPRHPPALPWGRHRCQGESVGVCPRSRRRQSLPLQKLQPADRWVYTYPPPPPPSYTALSDFPPPQSPRQAGEAETSVVSTQHIPVRLLSRAAPVPGWERGCSIAPANLQGHPPPAAAFSLC